MLTCESLSSGFFAPKQDTELLFLEKEKLSQSLFQQQIESCHQEWLSAGKPRLLDSFLPKFVLGIDEQHPKFDAYCLIGRKLILSLARRIFNQDIDVPINHFLVLMTTENQEVFNFYEDIFLGVFKDVPNYPLDILREIAIHYTDRFVWKDDVSNLISIKAKKTIKATKNKTLVVDQNFSTESFRLPRKRLKTFKDFLKKTKDIYRNITEIQVHREQRSFYFVGITTEQNFEQNFKTLLAEEKLKQIQTPLIIDFTKDCKIPKKIFKHKLMIDTQFLLPHIRNIFGEAYARVILGTDIPPTSFFDLKKRSIAFDDVKIQVDETFVENWNLTKNENPWNDLKLYIEI